MCPFPGCIGILQNERGRICRGTGTLWRPFSYVFNLLNSIPVPYSRASITFSVHTLSSGKVLSTEGRFLLDRDSRRFTLPSVDLLMSRVKEGRVLGTSYRSEFDSDSPAQEL